ncbi:hypothetical protein EHS13_23210 [Paenibacillus psychroresistens]|uniref:Phytanoyl-CoA dioxygenase n=1 Tax=Paenibacillus psychroresistens TaxID=1778678 RepID=A0A6B8RQM4_9BACL|nr:phytanoyl-CoA dioxygenase family protein [Paenibacillus psychroresistens]QGQ97588.1 hypothetical protein EHS13_23210 [Paenibacillus psychroresistens]
MQLTFDQKKQLLEDGYVKVPGVVPKIMVQEAMKAINYAIGQGIPAERGGLRPYQKLESQEVISNLINKTPAKDLLDSLLGEGMYHEINYGQVEPRFPEYVENPPQDHGAHIDGVLHLHEGTLDNFTALFGIILSDQTEPNRGNFTVYPGTHRAYADYFQEHGPEVLFQEEAFQTLKRSPNVPLPEPVQIVGEPGDLIITHYQLVHAGGTNSSDKIRYSCYYRIDHKDRKENWQTPLVDLWHHWSGMQSFSIG